MSKIHASVRFSEDFFLNFPNNWEAEVKLPISVITYIRNVVEFFILVVMMNLNS